MILWSAATCCSTAGCSKLIKLYQEVVLFPRMLIPSLYGSAAQILASIAICNSTCPKLPQFAATEASVRWEPLLTLFSMQNCTCLPIFMLCSSFAGSTLICQLREGYSGCSIRQISLRTEDSTSTLVFLRNASRGTTLAWSRHQNISFSWVWHCKSREMSKKRTEWERLKSKLEITKSHRLHFGLL